MLWHPKGILQPGQPWRRGQGGAVATTTWNSADKHADLSLSGGDLTVTATAGGFRGIRAIASQSSGKFYYENHPTTTDTPGLSMTGVADASYVLTDFVGADNSAFHSIGFAGDGNVYYHGGVLTTIQTWANNDYIAVAVDLTAELIWFRTISGGTPSNWNNNGAADPATGANGLDISAMTGPLFPAQSTFGNGDVATANFGGSAYQATVPSGYGNW